MPSSKKLDWGFLDIELEAEMARPLRSVFYCAVETALKMCPMEGQRSGLRSISRMP